MLKNYLKIALRTLTKNKAYTIINVLGLSLGLSCCIVILLYVQDETSYDKFFGNSDDTYRMVLERKYPDHISNFAIIPGGFSEILAEEIPEIKKSTRLVGFPNFSNIVKYEEKVFEEYIFPHKPWYGYLLTIIIALLVLWITKHFILHVI